MSAPRGLTTDRLREIALDACEQALHGATWYDAQRVGEWNTAIINALLEALIACTRPDAVHPPPYKFTAASTIIQHAVSPPKTGATSTATQAGADLGAESPSEHQQPPPPPPDHSKSGRRGMHSACGAFWDKERDGMWTYKWEDGEKSGIEIVINMVMKALKMKGLE